MADPEGASGVGFGGSSEPFCDKIISVSWRIFRKIWEN